MKGKLIKKGTDTIEIKLSTGISEFKVLDFVIPYLHNIPIDADIEFSLDKDTGQIKYVKGVGKIESEKPKEQKTSPEILEQSDDLEQIDDLTKINTIVLNGGQIMSKCKEQILIIFKDEEIPKENLVACINSLFIWSTKEIYFKSK